MLMASVAALSSHGMVASDRERALFAAAILIAFDAYLRGGTVLLLRPSELRPPRAQTGGHSTLTLFPSTHVELSKTRTQGRTVIIGATYPDRAWIAKLLVHVKAATATEERLFPFTGPRYLELFHASWKAASLPPSPLHRLRQGRLSMGQLLGRNLVSDSDIQSRGESASAKRVLRYRKPARYLRRLEKITAVQLAESKATPSLISRRVEALLSTRKRKR